MNEDHETGDLAEAALNRFRDLIGHDTAENHWKTNALVSAVNQWRDQVNVGQSCRQRCQLADEQNQRARMRDTIKRWQSRVEAHASADAIRPRPSRAELDKFRNVHLIRPVFRAWVAYCLTCVSESANNQLADQLHRSVLVKQAFETWIVHQNVAADAKRFDQRGQAFLNRQLLHASLECWKEQFRIWNVELTVSQIGRLAHNIPSFTTSHSNHDLVRLHGEQSVLRHYMSRWQRASRGQSIIRYDVGQSISNVYRHYLMNDVIHIWNGSIRRRAQLISSLNDMELVLRSCLKIETISRWKCIVLSEQTDVQNTEQANNHHQTKLLLVCFSAWRSTVLARRSEDHFIACSLKTAISRWRNVTALRVQHKHAAAFYEHHLVKIAWRSMWSLTVATHQSMQLHRQACLHHSHSAVKHVVSHWRSRAVINCQIRDNEQHADAIACRSQLANAISHLQHYSCKSMINRRFSAMIIVFQKEVVIDRLHDHAVKCRVGWQNLLKARRARYYSLLRSGFVRWKQCMERSKQSENLYFMRVAEPVLRKIQRTIICEWYQRTQYMRTDRAAQLDAIQLCKQNLLRDALRQWKLAKLVRMEDRANDNLAILHWSLQTRTNGLQQWLLNISRFRVHRNIHARAVAEYCSDLSRVTQHRLLGRWYELSVQYRVDKSRLHQADCHYRYVQQFRVMQTWSDVTNTGLSIGYRKRDALAHYEIRLMGDAFERWSQLFQLHVHLVRCHISALNHRRMLMLRRCWEAWGRFHAANRAQRQREQNMRQSRLQHLRIQGARQWIAMSVQLSYQHQQAALRSQSMSLHDVTKYFLRAKTVVSIWKRFVNRNKQLRHHNHNNRTIDHLAPKTNLDNSTSTLNCVVAADGHASFLNHNDAFRPSWISGDTFSHPPSTMVKATRKQRLAPRVRNELFETPSSSQYQAPSSSDASSIVWNTDLLDQMEKRLLELASLKNMYQVVKRQLDDMTRTPPVLISSSQSAERDRLLTACGEYQKQIATVKREIELWQHVG